MANEDLALVAAKRKHMILLSDGEAPIQGIKELVQEMVSEGMTASAVALGEDADKNLMKLSPRCWSCSLALLPLVGALRGSPRVSRDAPAARTR